MTNLGLAVFAVVALGTSGWGWFNIRRQQHENWGLVAFLLGMALWGYTVKEFIGYCLAEVTR